MDSIGALVPAKLLNDADKGKQVSDMGLKAKLINNLVKGCTIPSLRSDCSIIFINHTYDDPSAMYTSKIKNMGGGKGIGYQSSLTIQTSSVLEKSDSKTEEGAFSGNVLKFFTTKNRFVQPYKEATVKLDFATGASKYYGLFDVAVLYGFIIPKGAWFEVPSYAPGKNLRSNFIMKTDAVWDTFLDELDKMSMDELRYGSKINLTEDFTDTEDTEEVDVELLKETMKGAKVMKPTIDIKKTTV